MKKLIVANWKANKSGEEAIIWAERFAQLEWPSEYQAVVCPAFPHIATISSFVEEGAFELGAQDISAFDAGAYTGEVPAHVLQDYPVTYVIVGHSERRKYQHEDSVLVGRKAIAAIEAGLTPIVCVDREQVHEQAAQFTPEQLRSIVVAYEPVHAISTFGGHEDPIDVTLKAIADIKRAFGSNVPVIYGGSVDPKDSLTYLEEASIDGVLVGHASLDPETFVQLVTGEQS